MRTLVKMITAVILVVLVACTGMPGGGQEFAVLAALEEQGLTGKLVFIHSRSNGSRLVRFDLATGEVETLFTPPEKAWLASAEVSPDGSQILLAYAPPPENNQVQFGNTDLYLMPASEPAEPAPLLIRSARNESFAHPTWAPDGQSIYYTHVIPSETAPAGVEYQIERLNLGGNNLPVLPGVIWPRISPDGSQMAYLSVVPSTDGNDLMLAGADGSSPTALMPPRRFVAVDDHVFSPDGKTILFSTVSEEAAAPARQPGRLALGVTPVQAHDLPSDWYQIDIATGEMRQVTHIQQIGLYAAYSPDGEKIAFISQEGMYVMNPDGSQLIQIARAAAIGGLSWVP